MTESASIKTAGAETPTQESEGQTTLRLRFSGLNLFVKSSAGYRVLVTDARAATAGKDRHKLHRHTPYLVVEKGSLTIEGRNDKPFHKKWPCNGRFKDRILDFIELTGNFEYRLSPPPVNGGDSVNEPVWLPHLGGVDARVDPGADLEPAPVAATFFVRKGELSHGGDEIRVSWQGDHKGTDLPEHLYEWTELVYSVPAERVTLRRPGRDWFLTPPEGENEVIAWIGNATDADCGQITHDHPPASHAADHFKWLYEHAGLRPQPITDLAYPVVSQQPLIKNNPHTLTSTFCPDGQYP